jgi:tetratricopeptide (TPR) repeat protein
LGDLAIAEAYMLRSLDMARQLNYIRGIGEGLFYLGRLYIAIGDLEKAWNCISESSEIGKKIGYIRLSAWNSRKMGQISLRKGELPEALEYLQDNIIANEIIKDKMSKAHSLYDIATIQYEQGDLINALENAEKSYEIYNELQSDLHKSETLMLLIRTTIDNNNLDQAKLYSEYLNDISKSTSNNVIIQRNQIASAILHKTSLRSFNRAEAEKILRAVVDEEIVNSESSTIALINLCDILLEEYRLTGDISVLNDLQVFTKQLHKIAQNQASHSLKLEAQHIRIMTLWLQAQQSVTDIDLKEIQSLLTNTQELAEMKGLFGLAQRIFIKHNKMLDHLKVWDEFLRSYYELIKS